MKTSNQPPAGFTLVEVLVALLILALAMTAWQLRISSQLDSAGYLRDKTLALWVADNQLHYLQLAQRQQTLPLPAVQSGTVQLAGRHWYWQLSLVPGAIEATQTGTSTLQQSPVPVVIGVSADNGDAALQHPVATLTGVLYVH